MMLIVHTFYLKNEDDPCLCVNLYFCSFAEQINESEDMQKEILKDGIAWKQ